MKRIIFIVLFAFICGFVNSQTATRIRDLTTESSLTDNDWYVIDRLGYGTLKKISFSLLKSTINSGYAPLVSPTFTGAPLVPLPLLSDSSYKIAPTAWIRAYVIDYTSSLVVSGTNKVLYNLSDASAGFLDTKIVAGSGINLSSYDLGGGSYALKIFNIDTTLASLYDVEISSPSAKDPLVWDASVSKWVPGSEYGAGALSYVTELSDLSDVIDLLTPSNNEVLRYNAGTGLWENSPSTNGLWETKLSGVKPINEGWIYNPGIPSWGVAINPDDGFVCYNSGDSSYRLRKFSEVVINNDTVNGCDVATYILTETGVDAVIYVDSVQYVCDCFIIKNMGIGSSLTVISLENFLFNGSSSIVLSYKEEVTVCPADTFFTAVVPAGIDSIFWSRDTVNEKIYPKHSGDTVVVTNGLRVEGVSLFKDDVVIRSDFSDGMGYDYTLKVDGTTGEMHYVDTISKWGTDNGANQIAGQYFTVIRLYDDAVLSLPDGQWGWCKLSINGITFADFDFQYDGTVLLGYHSANVVDTDTDMYLCIFDGGASVSIRNRLGTTAVILIQVIYTAPSP